MAMANNNNLIIDQNDIARRLLELSNSTGYTISQNHGQRIYGGPPPGWSGQSPGRGTEVYCYRIPRDCFEDELVPVFQSIGKIFELRLMIEFSGANRSYCYVRYCSPEDAKSAIMKLNNYQIRPGYPLAVTKSVDNRKLCVKTVPPLDQDVTEQEAARELSNIIDGVIGVRFIARRWLQVEFESHRLAALARRQLVPGNMTMFGHVEIKQVDWADPDVEGYAKHLMAQNLDNKVIKVGKIGPGVTEEAVKHWFNMISSGQVENVVRSGGYFLITFQTSEAASLVMEQGHNLEGSGGKLSLSWWSPPNTAYQHKLQLPVMTSPPPTIIGPLERLHSLCERQGWGTPQYHCATFLDNTGQWLYQYNVSLPNVSRHHLYGEASHDKHMALINSACAALQGITEASVQQFSHQMVHTPSHYRTPPAPPPMTLLQPPPAISRPKSNIKTVARPTKEETNLLGNDATDVHKINENYDDTKKPMLAVPPNPKVSYNKCNSPSNACFSRFEGMKSLEGSDFSRY